MHLAQTTAQAADGFLESPVEIVAQRPQLCLWWSKCDGLIDDRAAGHLGAADGLKTLRIHVCVCPHFGM